MVSCSAAWAMRRFSAAMTGRKNTLPLRLADTDPELFYYRGVLRLAREDYEEALVDFDAAIGLGYGTALAYYNRGVCYLTLEDYERLLADMQKVVELNEDEELTQIAQQLIAELTVGSEQES